MNNNKGFSLVEILAVIVILGVISTIGIVSVTRLIDSSKSHFYETQRSQLILAAQAYAGDHKEILPRNIYEKNKIELKELYENKYIKDTLVDKDKSPCDPEKTYVNIYKSSQTEYKYKGYLYCDSCKENGCYDEKEKQDLPNIEITLPNIEGNDLFNDTKTIDILMQANGDNALIGSYSYKLYVNNALVFNSGNKISNKKSELTIKEKIFKYLPGKIKVVATMTNTEGDKKTVSKSQDYNDAISPLCGNVTYLGNNTMKKYNPENDNSPTSLDCGSNDYKWVNKSNNPYDRKAWIECNDSKGIGCAQQEYTKYLNTDGAVEVLEVKDTKNNSHNCNIMKCIDRADPVISFSIKSQNTSYNTATVDVTIKAKDETSGINKFCLSKNDNCSPTSNLTGIGIINEEKTTTTTFNISSRQDGTSSKVTLCVTDKAGNKKCIKTPTAYTVYKACSQTVDDGASTCGQYGACSKKCGGGTQTAAKVQKKKDKFLGTACTSVTTANGCSRDCNTDTCTVSCSVSYSGTASGYNNGWYKSYGSVTINVQTNGTLTSQGLAQQSTKLTSGNSTTSIRITSDQDKKKYQCYAKISERTTAATNSRTVGVDTKKPYVDKVYNDNTYCSKSRITTNHPNSGQDSDRRWYGQWSFIVKDSRSGLHYVVNKTCKKSVGDTCSSCTATNNNCRVYAGAPASGSDVSSEAGGVWWRFSDGYHYAYYIDAAGNRSNDIKGHFTNSTSDFYPNVNHNNGNNCN